MAQYLSTAGILTLSFLRHAGLSAINTDLTCRDEAGPEPPGQGPSRCALERPATYPRNRWRAQAAIWIGDRGKRAGARVIDFHHDADMPPFALTDLGRNERADLSQ